MLKGKIWTKEDKKGKKGEERQKHVRDEYRNHLPTYQAKVKNSFFGDDDRKNVFVRPSYTGKSLPGWAAWLGCCFVLW
jgi:hypothetical protein